MKINQNTSILFWLFKAKQTEDGKAPIYCRITIEGKRSEFSIGKKIQPNLWNTEAGEARGKTEEAVSINRELRKIQGSLQKTYDQLEALHERVTAEMVKNAYLGIGPRHKTVLELFTEYNKIVKERAEAKEPTLSKATWQRFEIGKKKVTAFLKYKYGTSEKFIRDLKNTFGEDFKHYLTTVENICMNTAWKYLKIAKQVFRYAIMQEYIPTSPMAAFKCTYKNPKRERLTWQELVHLYETPMAMKRLEEVRDVYVFSCFTGYAYMDTYKLTPENVILWIDGSKWMIRDRSKNDNKSNVPLMDIPLAIIEKYRNHPYCLAHHKLLPVNSNQRYNAYLKEIATIAGIDKKLTTHTARHTFATTVLLEHDCPIESASEMLGHNSIRTTQIYAKTTDVKVSRNMKEVRAKITGKLQVAKTGS